MELRQISRKSLPTSWPPSLCKVAIFFAFIGINPKLQWIKIMNIDFLFISWSVRSVQSLSCVWLFATPWTAARQTSLSITNSWSLLKLMSIESVMSPNHLILCRPLLLPPSTFPASGSFPMSQFFASGGQSIGASASVLPMNIQGWFPLGIIGLITLQSKGLSRVFSNTGIQKHQFSGTQLHGPTLTSTHDYWKSIALTTQTFIS